MNITEFYNEVARRADTDKTAITVAETKRVLSEAFLVLSAMDAADCTQLLGKALTTAKKKAAKK